LAGVEEHHGHVMARALADKLDKFLKTFASFERAFLQARSRQTDFEVVNLSHNSPASIELRPVSRIPSYLPAAALDWTMVQWDRIARGVLPDEAVDEELIGDVAELARKQDEMGYADFKIDYQSKAISFDESAYSHAIRLRTVRRGADYRPPWRAGKALGSITGELRSVLDADSERQIVICPPVGPSQILCVFTDDMRDQIKNSMWQYVRVNGVLTYGEKGPHPVIIEIRSIDDVPYNESAPHISEGRGLFGDSHYETWAGSDL
jgi:hypothetical protein